MQRLLAVMAALLAGFAVLPAEGQGTADPVPGSEPFRRTFLDAMVVEESAGLERVFHEAEKHPANPVLKRDKPWEGWGPYVYGTVLRDQGKLKMWYQVIGDGSRICYGESTDGIRWEKPELGIHEFQGSRANNIVVEGRISIPSVIKNPNPDSADKKWMMYGYGDGGPILGWSADGLRWEWEAPPAGQRLFTSSDVVNFLYDPYQSRFAATWKLGAHRHRSAGLALSSDGLNWEKLMNHPVMTADDLDPDATQIYGMPVFPYQGMYIGLPWMYHARFFKYGEYTVDRLHEAQMDSPRTADVQLAWSWNMVNWTRPCPRQPFIPLGPEGSWDDSMIFTARAPVEVDGRLFFYYGGFDQPHDEYRGIKGEIGLATLRLDGFCGMSADDEEGWLISRRELFRVPRVIINARTRAGGYVEAEILDRDNKVLPGFSRQECVRFSGDETAHELRWKTGVFPEDVLTRDRKIRFYLRNAEVFSYLPVEVDESDYEGRP